MCFAPQRRSFFRHLNCQKWSGAGVFCAFWLGNVLHAATLFRHLNFQKWSDAGVFCTFWLGNVLRARTACTFSTSQLPKVVRTWCVLCIFTSKCASRHNGVQFFISHLASWLRTRRFSKPTFRPSEAPDHWKNTVFRDFPTLSRICNLLSSYSFSSTLLSSNLSLLSASSLLCFSPVHIVGSLTSNFLRSSLKLPIYRIIYRYIPTWPMLSGQGASRAVRGDARLRWGQQGAAGCSKRLKLKKSSKELSWEVLNYWMIVFMTEKMNVQIVHH